MSFAVSAFLFGALAVQTNAQELNTIWERTTLNADLPSWFTVGSVRGMAYGTVDGNKRIYAADRENNTIRVLDAVTGEDVTPATAFDLTGVGGGTYALNDVEVSDDGVIFLGNLASDTSPFRLYWWTQEGGAYADSLTIPVAGRVGDKFTVVGSLADNTIEVWLPVASVDPGIVYVATTADQGANWDIETITLTGTITALGGSIDANPLAPGRTSDFYVGGNGSAPARYSSNGEYVENSVFNSSSRNGMQAFQLDGKDHLAVYTYRPDGVSSGNMTGMVYVYDVSDAENPTIVGETPLMGADVSTYSSIHGSAKAVVNGDGTYNIYGLDGVNGLAAYTNAAEPVYVDTPSDKVFFSEYIEGSGNNRALEIYNGTDSTVTLVNYRIAQAHAGNWQNFHEFKEGATIEAGGVYVLLNADTPDSVFNNSLADEVLEYQGATSETPFDNPTHFTGKKALAIIHVDPVSDDTTWTDVFGEVTDASDGWNVAGVTGATIDHTLIRKPSISAGNSTPLGSFGTNADDSEWIVKPQNFFDNLGKPSADLFAPLAGDYYVPKRTEDAQGFGSLYEALYAVSQSGLSAATTIFITDDITDTVGVSINRSDLTESTPLTIKPAPGVTPTLDVVSNGGDGIAIIQTDYFTIDGSNTDGGTTRDLTITSSDEGLSNMVWTKAVSNTTIKNTIITYTGTKQTVSGITPNTTGTTASSGWLIENNQIGTENGDFHLAVYPRGVSSSNTGQGHKIIGNDIYTNRRGIATWHSEDTEIIGNTITIASPAEDQSWYSGIYLANAYGTTNVTGNTIKGLQVNHSTSESYAGGILLNGNSGTVNITNNVVDGSDFKNVGDAVGNRVYGIGINYAGDDADFNIYHNTIRIGSSDETGVHAAFGMATVTSSTQTWDVKNNIFIVDQDSTNASAIHWPLADGETSTLEADYNNYYVSGATANIGMYGETGGDLAAWQTASSQDANTTAVDVDFVSATDYRLGLSDGDANLAGTPLASVTEDFDGTTRNTEAPYKGAFEGSIDLDEDGVSNEFSEEPLRFSLAQNYPNPFNPTSNIQFTLPETNNVRLDVFNINGQLVQTLVNSRMNAGEHTVQFDAGNLASGVYMYRITSGNFVQSKKMTLIK